MDETSMQTLARLSFDDLSLVIKECMKRLNILKAKKQKTEESLDLSMDVENEPLPQNTDLDNSFELPRKTAKHTKKPETPMTTVHNRFEGLTNLENDHENPSESQSDVPSTSQTIKSSSQDKAKVPSTQNKSTFKSFSPTVNTVRIPPVIIRDKSKWMQISKKLADERINFTNAKNSDHGIKVSTPSSDDYRRLTKFLDKHNHVYYTHKLPEDKNLKIVLRGVPVEISEEEIIQDLHFQNITPIKVIRMTKTAQKVPMPLVLVLVPQEMRRLYDISSICGLSIKVEPLINTLKAGQCHRCQLYGHGQSQCTAPFVCVKCGQEHGPGQCQLARKEPATCANCKGPHPANFSGCPFHPKNRQPPTSKPAPLPTKNVWAQLPTAPKTSHAQNTVPNTQAASHNNTAEITKILGNMLLQFSAKNPTPQEAKQFASDATKLIQLTC